MCPGQEYEFLFQDSSHLLIPCRIAYTELYLALAMIFRRFELQLFDTNRERDIDIQRDCFLGEPDIKTQGVRVKVVAMSEE